MLVMSYCSVAMVWPTDICAVVTSSSNEARKSREEGPHNIKSKLTRI